MKIDGKQIAQEIYDQLAERVEKIKQSHDVIPRLDIILIGDNPASVAYVGQKEKFAASIGAQAVIHRFPSDTTNEVIETLVNKLNNDPLVHGCIIQRPVPKHITINLNELVNPDKDVDGFHPQTPFSPPIALAVWEILKYVFAQLPKSLQILEEWLASQKIVVIGKGEAGGKPITAFLREQKLDPVIIDSKTADPTTVAKSADILIPSIGKHVVTKEMIKPGAIVIGVGMYRGEDGKLHPDYEMTDVASVAAFYTPVPGGVGPVNVATLLSNLITATEKQLA